MSSYFWAISEFYNGFLKASYLLSKTADFGKKMRSTKNAFGKWRKPTTAERIHKGPIHIDMKNLLV